MPLAVTGGGGGFRGNRIYLHASVSSRVKGTLHFDTFILLMLPSFLSRLASILFYCCFVHWFLQTAFAFNCHTLSSVCLMLLILWPAVFFFLFHSSIWCLSWLRTGYVAGRSMFYLFILISVIHHSYCCSFNPVHVPNNSPVFATCMKFFKYLIWCFYVFVESTHVINETQI